MANSEDEKNGGQAPLATHSAPIFMQNAEDLVSRLANDPSAAAQVMMREAQELADRFRRWQVERPPNDVRVAAIQQLFELSRRAREYLSRGPKPPPPEAVPPTMDGFMKRLFRRS